MAPDSWSIPMKPETQKRPLLRLIKVFTAVIALPLVALAPALLASLVFTDRIVEVDESTEQVAAIDVTDIAPEGTVMYTVSSLDSYRGTSGSNMPTPRSILEDADLIKVTIQDDDGHGSWLGQDSEDDCTFTLHLSPDDPFDDQTDTFTGYIRVTEDDFFAYSDPEQQENCGLYLIYTR